MACAIEDLKSVPLFSLLDEDEGAVLAAQLSLRKFGPRQRIYKAGDAEGQAYVVVDGSVRVTTYDQDNQEVVVDEAEPGGFFGFAAMLEGTPHQTDAVALAETTCLEVRRQDIATLLQRKPLAGMDMLTVLARQFHGSQELVRVRSTRSPNEIIETEATSGERVADHVARFGGSWTFIIMFAVVLVAYTVTNILLGTGAWDPYPFILLNLFLSMLAAVQAPVIMMSQNRQDTKDRLRGELDYDVNRRAAADIQGLARKLNTMAEKMGDLEDLIRGQLGADRRVDGAR
jgi:CRP/FNR family transcriptional regulator, cyclic AMP receptor protein